MTTVRTPLAFAEASVLRLPVDSIDLADTTFMFRSALRLGPLKESIRADGQHIPVIVRRKPAGAPDGRFQLISGFRRTTAIQELGLPSVAAIVRDDLTDDLAAFRASVAENAQRKSYSDIERAHVIRSYKARGFTGDDVASMMGLTRRQATNLQGLLTLEPFVQEAIDDPEQHFSATHGLILKQHAARVPDLDFRPWIARVNEEELSVAKLQRALNQECHAPSAPLTLFNDRNTDPDSRVFQLKPMKIEVDALGPSQKRKLRADLEVLLKALG